jgi:hypothetical protein
MDQSGQTRFVALNALDFVPILRLPRQPGAIHAGPLSEVESPSVIFRFLAADVSRVKGLRAKTVLPLERKQFFFERVNISQDLPGRHNLPFGGSMRSALKNASGMCHGYPRRQPQGILAYGSRRIMKPSHKTGFMGVSFRNAGEILEQAGCDLLTISPQLFG